MFGFGESQKEAIRPDFNRDYAVTLVQAVLTRDYAAVLAVTVKKWFWEVPTQLNPANISPVSTNSS
jgi:hypothetical protein